MKIRPLFLTAMLALSGALLAIGLSGCGGQGTTPVVLNSNGTPTNTAETVAGSAYLGYIAVDTAWLGALKAGKVPAATVASVEPKRKAARAALDAFAAASIQGDTAAAQSAFTSAEAAFLNGVTGAGIVVQTN